MWLKLMYFILIKSTLSMDQKWIWGDKNREQVQEAASRQASEFLGPRVPLRRYEIYENQGIGGLGGYGGYGGPANFPRPSQGPSGYYGGVSNQGPLTEINKCKCTEKFNCPSSALAYGSCDVGKKYCCQGTHGPLSEQPVHSIQNGVLSGPGGPVDGLYNQGGLYGNSGGYGQGGPYNTGVLVGPGGPNGVVQSPQGYFPRPQGVLVGPGGPTGSYYPQNYQNPGVLVGPGGPTGTVYRPQNPFEGSLGGYQGGPYSSFGYGRSAPSSRNDKNDKNDNNSDKQ